MESEYSKVSRRDQAYEKTNKLANGQIGNMMVGAFMIILASFICTFIADLIKYGPEVTFNFLELIQQENFSVFNFTILGFILEVFTTSVVSIVTGLFIISMIRYVRRSENGGVYEISDMADAFKSNPSKIIIVGLIIGVVSTLLMLIPIGGAILNLIFTLIVSFIYLIIDDNPDLSIGEIFKYAYDNSNGHKGSIVMINLKYLLLPAIIYVIFFIIVFSRALDSGGIWTPILIIGTIIFFIVTLRFNSYNQLAISIYYDNILRGYEGDDDYNIDDYNIIDDEYKDSQKFYDDSEILYDNKEKIEVVHLDENGEVIDSEEI